VSKEADGVDGLDAIDPVEGLDDVEAADGAPDSSSGEHHPILDRIPLRKSRRQREAESLSDRLSQQFAHQWAQIRAERKREPEPIRTGPSNFSRAHVPWGVDLAAAWAWRVLIIGLAVYVLFRLLTFLAIVTLPVIVALLIAALFGPVVSRLADIGIPRGISSAFVVVGGIASVAALLTFAGQQVASGATDLADQVVAGLDEIKTWLRDGPLHASDSQINDFIDKAQESITAGSQDGEIVKQLSEVGTALSHLLAAFFIILFSTYFFLADGARIWSWVVRLAPRAAREKVDSSGRVAWRSLTMFVRATVLVAATDAMGIMLVAAVLRVPFVLAIGVLVFLGAFIPMIGATVAGTVAILVALVDQGPVTALFMLVGVVIVQQIEGHVLQPFLMGRFVSVHPLGVILAIGCGVLVAGVAGALIAVPFAAAMNAVVQHLASFTSLGDDAEERLEKELGPDRTEIPAEAEDA
jgi:putative heme transporter